MSNKCVEGIYGYIKGDNADADIRRLTSDMSKSDVDVAVKTIRNTARNLLKNDSSLNQEQALEKASRLVIENLKQEIERQKRDARLDLLAYSRKKLEAQGNNFDAKKLESRWFSARLHEGTGVRQGFESKRDAKLNELLEVKGALNPELDKIDGFAFLRDRKDGLENQRKVANQLMSESFTNDQTGKVARLLNDHGNRMIKMLNESGITVRRLAGRVARQYHDSRKLLEPRGLRQQVMKKLGASNLAEYFAKQKAMGSKEFAQLKTDTAFGMWHDYIKPRLDQRLSLIGTDWSDDKAVRAALRDTFDKITDPVKKSAPGGYSLAKRLAGSDRHYFFKDGSSWVDYANEYGAGDILQSVYNEAKTAAHNMTMYQEWGANPISTLEKLQDDIRDNNPRHHKPTESALKKMDTQMKYMSNMLHPDSDAHLGSFVKSIQAFNIMTRMGMVVIHSLSDLTNQWRTLSTVGETFPNKIANSIRQVKLGFSTSDEEKEFFQSLGVMSKHMIGHRYTPDMEDFTGALSKGSQLALKMSGLPWYDRALKKGTMAGFGSLLGRNANLTFDSLPDRLKNYLNLYGFTPDEWNLWRKGHANIGGTKYMSPSTILDASDDDMAKVDLTKGELYNKAMAFYLDQYRFTVPSYSLLDKAYKSKMMQAWGKWGHLINLFMQFKSYAVGFTQNLLMRDVAMATSKVGAIKNLTSTITGVMALGLAGQIASNVLKDQGVPDFNILSDDPKKRENAEYTWSHGILSALGMYGDIVGALTNTHSDVFSLLAGPSFSEFNDTKNFFINMAKRSFRGSSDNQRKSSAMLAEQLAQKNFPFANTPIATVLMHYYLGRHIMDSIQPGSYEAQVQQMKDKYGVTPLVN